MKETLFPVEELKQVKLASFWSDKSIEIIRRNIQDPYYRAEIGESVEYAYALEDICKQAGNPPTGQEWKMGVIQDAIDYLRWASLPIQLEEIIKYLFSSRVRLALEREIDCIERTTALFMSSGALSLGWERWQAILRDALRQNKELLGSSDVTIETATGKVSSTLGAWVRHYDAQTTVQHQRTSVERVAYVNKTEEIRLLVTQEQKELLAVLSVYDLIVFMPYQVVSTQEIKARTVSLPLVSVVLQGQEGQDVNTAPLQLLQSNEKNLSSVVVPKAVVVPTPPTPQRVVDDAREIDRRLSAISNAPQDPVKNILQALSAKNSVEAQAQLRYVALSGELPDIMINPEIMKTFKPYLERKMGQAAALAYTSKPKRPAYVKLFLQWVFEDQLGMTPEEAQPRIEPIVKILAVDDPEFGSGS